MDSTDDGSLIALATHFAQVQFRLKQIISAAPEQKEDLLKELEEFAFQGCPTSYDTAAAGECSSTEAQNTRYQQLIQKLRTQLHELERCAHQEGAGGPLEASLAEKQVIVIEELVRRFDLKFGDLDHLSTNELRESVDKAIHRVVDAKEEMVSRLQTQIQDLERYIQFLQESSHEPLTSVATEREEPRRKRVSFVDNLPVRYSERSRMSDGDASSSSEIDGGLPRYRLAMDELQAGRRKLSVMDPVLAEWETKASRGKPYDPEQIGVLMMKKTLTIMQILTLWQCGGRVNCLPKYANLEKKRLRYQLSHISFITVLSRTALQSMQLAVDKVSIITNALNQPDISDEEVVQLETDLHEAVSMNLADPLRLLLEHGLLSNQYIDQSPSCLPMWGSVGREDAKECGAWKVIMHYYRLKGGDDLSQKPEQMLLLSFSLQPEQCSLKKSLLAAVHKVEKSFSGCYIKSPDTKFRALICEGFNQSHLAEWFSILATHPNMAEDLYSRSSFLASTRFRPAVACLERLKDTPACSPVELPMGYYQCSETFF